MTGRRVAEDINAALHELFANDSRLYFLGEDIEDPYGGAFKISKGLSTAYPGRVISTPLSEGGIVGVANGLALCGNKVIVEIMFGDFLALAFDQLLNFASKSVSMYGRRVPMPLVVRCPVGGRRGYGPTHSQSIQKHLLGIPNLCVYEMSPFHSAAAVLASAFDQQMPSVVFEDKVLYTQRRFEDGFSLLGGDAGWAHVRGSGRADVVVIAPGGVAGLVLEAAGRSDVCVDVVVPARLYPLDVDAVLPVLGSVGRVCVVEDGTAGGTWGAEVAARLYPRLWSSLDGPIELVSAPDSIVPSAPHLERDALPSVSGVVSVLGGSTVGTPITAPKLNNNDDSYVVVEWLVADGGWVDAGTPVVTLETSKAVEEIEVQAAGHVTQLVRAGSECGVGAVLGRVSGVASDVAPVAQQRLSRVQRGTAAVVSRSHREVPAAFTVVRVEVEVVLEWLDAVSSRTGGGVGLVEVLVKALALGYEEFPLFFGRLVDGDTVELAECARVGVTLDVGAGLFVPVVDGSVGLEAVADVLMDFRRKALRGSFSGRELSGARITLSVNISDGVVFVSPLVMWPQLCMVSVGGVQGSSGGRFVYVGLAYDHRVVNGRDAVLFLQFLKGVVESPTRLESLL